MPHSRHYSGITQQDKNPIQHHQRKPNTRLIIITKLEEDIKCLLYVATTCFELPKSMMTTEALFCHSGDFDKSYLLAFHFLFLPSLTRSIFFFKKKRKKKIFYPYVTKPYQLQLFLSSTSSSRSKDHTCLVFFICLFSVASLRG